MTLVRNTATRADGTPVAGARVTIGRLGVRYVPADEATVIYVGSVTTNDVGYWETDLIEGVYVIEEGVGGSVATHRIVVPDTGSHWLGDLLDGDLTDDELTAFAAHIASNLHVPTTGDPGQVLLVNAEGQVVWGSPEVAGLPTLEELVGLGLVSQQMLDDAIAGVDVDLSGLVTEQAFLDALEGKADAHGHPYEPSGAVDGHEADDNAHPDLLRTTDAIATYVTQEDADNPETGFVRKPDGDAAYAQRGNNLSDLADPAAARTNIGAAPAHGHDFDPAGSADAAYAEAIKRANHTGSQAITTVTGLQAALDGKQSADGDVQWVAADMLSASFGSPTKVTALFRWPAWNMSGTTEQVLGGSIVLPVWWATYHVDVYWTNLTANSGDVRFYGNSMAALAPGSALNPNAANAFTVAAQPAQNVLAVTRIATGVAAGAGRLARAWLGRDGAGAADTSSDAATILGLLLTRAS